MIIKKRKLKSVKTDYENDKVYSWHNEPNAMRTSRSILRRQRFQGNKVSFSEGETSGNAVTSEDIFDLSTDMVQHRNKNKNKKIKGIFWPNTRARKRPNMGPRWRRRI